MPTTVTDLSVQEILKDVPADTSRVSSNATPVSTEHVATWKAEAEARAALLLRSQDASTTLSDDAKLFASEFVKARVIGRVLRKMRLFDLATEYLEEASALESVLKNFEEQLDQPDIGAGSINSNINTSNPTPRRWGSNYDGL